jgi:predicted anti-sigma-YlaC factor YlaD
MDLQTKNNKNSETCPQENIIAYLDGELSPPEELEMDLHLANCKTCSAELNAQKQVSTSLEIFLDELDDEIELPKNFTEVIKTRAESNVSGLRQPKERSLAFFISAVLILLSIIGLGTEVETFWLAIDKFTHQFLAVGGFIWHTVHNISLGLAVILRALSHHFVYSSITTSIFILGFFMVLVLTLSRMVFRYNRT